MISAYQKEKGAATIIEYSVVLPIVLISVMALMYMAFIQFQRASTESCVERALTYATRVVTDTNYETYATITEHSNDLDSFAVSQDKVSNDPYRYWSFNFSSQEAATQAELERLLSTSKLTIFKPNTDVSVDISKKYLVFTQIEITVTQDYKLLKLFSVLGLPSEGSIVVSGKTFADQPSELIRNTDYAAYILAELGLDITNAGSEIISKISYLLDRIGVDF